MYFKSIIAITATAVLLTGQTSGAVLGSSGPIVARIATDPISACGAPNNSDHKEGSSCKYHAGPSDDSQTLSGKCVQIDEYLYCIAT